MTLKFNRETFFNEFRKWRGSISQQQFKGLNFLLDSIEKDPFVTRIDWAAYMLATTMHETAYTFMPIHEYGSHAYFVRRYGSQTAKGRELGNDTPEEGADYAGQGDVQLTGESNYEKAEVALRREYPALVADFERRTGKRFDLTVGDQPDDKDDPKNAQDPMIAYAIMSFGMRSGMFTGRKLSDFLNDKRKDYSNARKIINGRDKAETIAGYALSFERVLGMSLIREDEFKATSDSQIVLGEKQKDDTFPALPDNEPLESNSSADNSQSAPAPDTNPQGDTVQSADQITNIDQSQKSVPDSFIAEDKNIAAPPPSNMLTRGWKWILGLGLVPTTASGVIESVKNLSASGAFQWSDVFEVVKQMMVFLIPYLVWIAIAFVVFWGIKELLKQISFIVNQYTLARCDMHNVKVVPQGDWQNAQLPELPQAVSAVSTTTGLVTKITD